MKAFESGGFPLPAHRKYPDLWSRMPAEPGWHDYMILGTHRQRGPISKAAMKKLYGMSEVYKIPSAMGMGLED